MGRNWGEHNAIVVVQNLLRSKKSFFKYLFVGLDMVSNSKVSPVVERHSTFCSFPHFGHILLYILERAKSAYGKENQR